MEKHHKDTFEFNLPGTLARKAETDEKNKQIRNNEKFVTTKK